MLFNSLQYALFLPLLTAVYFWAPRSWRLVVLLVGSYVFYAAASVRFCLLLFGVAMANQAGAQLVHVQADVGHTSIDTTEQVYNNAARDPSRSAVDLVGDVLALSAE